MSEKATLIASIFAWIFLMIGWYRFTSPAPTLLGRISGVLFLIMGSGLLLVALSTAYFQTTLPVYHVGAIIVFFGGILLVAMFFLLAAPTFEGAKVLSRIEGFKLYMETAETNRLNMRDAPEMTEELYERYLPYAAGLGVEEPWSKAYSAHLARAHPGEEERDYQPNWYHGRRWREGSLAEATAASMAAVSAAMAASMPQPKSSSGSSGGGSSGGGGGGGGGGGW